MAGYIGSKAVLLSTTAATVAGNALINGNLTVDTNTLFVDSSNNSVGIGTSSPSVPLHVAKGGAGDEVARFNNAGGFGLRIVPQVGGAGAVTALRVAGGEAMSFETNSTERMRITSQGSVQVGSYTATAYKLFVYDNTANAAIFARQDGTGPIQSWHVTGGAEVARISNTGRLGIGTIAAGDSWLHANNATASSFAASFTNTATNGFGMSVGTSSSVLVYFYGNGARSGGPIGSITTNGTSTSYNSASDYRLKEDVQPMVGASDRLLALKPVNFAWKADGSRVDGFLAHEAQEVVPEAVTGFKDETDAEGNPVYQGIDQSKLVPLLTAALQESLKKIEKLEARVAALETK